jgi:hypothetical protein
LLLNHLTLFSMKTKLTFFGMLCLFNLSFGQNQSSGAVNTTITTAANSAPLGPQFGSEVFRFRPGLVTQLDFGGTFDFTTTRWFAMGRIAAGTQTFYGMRFQLPNKSIVMGYNDLSAINPRIEWIGSSAASTLGNLEFRVGSGFGSPGSPGANLLVATMANNGTTIFGTTNPFGTTATSPKVGIISTTSNVALEVQSAAAATSISASGGSVGVNATGSNVAVVASSSNVGVSASGGNVGVTASGITGVTASGSIGVQVKAKTIGADILCTNGVGANITSNAGQGFTVDSSNSPTAINIGGTIKTSTGKVNTGLDLVTTAAVSTIGVNSFADQGFDSNIAVKGTTFGKPNFSAGIYGETPNFTGNNWAGFFDGDVFATGSYQPSDTKLKENVKEEGSVLEKIAQLKSVTYDYKTMRGLNLPQGTQHGFIAQEVAKIFPELTRDIKKPIFDKQTNTSETFEFKSVNYNGLISVLTAGINELNQELKLLKEEIATLREGKSLDRKSLGSSSANIAGAFMEQNVPNPFGDQTTIRYQLPEGTNTADLMVFDLNGRMIKSYVLNKNQSEITIKAAEIGSGLFLYSLVQNGQELMTKKMIVK